MLDGEFLEYNGKRIFVPVGHFASEVIRQGLTPEEHVVSVFRRLVKEGQTVLDVGANIGFHTLPLADIVGPQGKVYAIEADIDNATCVQASLVENAIKNVRLFPVAAGDSIGVIEMLESVGTNSVFSSTVASGGSSKVAVTVRMDDIIDDKVDFIKIDIEGAELLACRGMNRLLKSNPMVLTEFSPGYISRSLGSDRSSEYIQFFLSRGYKCAYLQPSGELVEKDGLQAILECQQQAQRDLNWGHVELLFFQGDMSL
jgi:FkbM family methyltransferase